MKRKVLMIVGLMLAFSWSLFAAKDVVGSNKTPTMSSRAVAEYDRSHGIASVPDNLDFDAVLLPQQERWRPAYITGAGTADTMSYCPEIEGAFSWRPGDYQLVMYKMSADGIIKGVNPRPRGWADDATDKWEVSLWKVTYPWDSKGDLYSLDAVDPDGWTGYWTDGVNDTVPLFKTDANAKEYYGDSADEKGPCFDTDPVANSQDLVMEKIWPPSEFVHATIDPSTAPGREDKWIATIDFGGEPELKAGDWVGVLVENQGEIIEFSTAPLCEGEGIVERWVFAKFYGANSECDGTSGEGGWHIRHWVIHWPIAVELTGDRAPIISDVAPLPTTVSTEGREAKATVTDDNPAGGDAGVVSVTLKYIAWTPTNKLGKWTEMDMTADGDVYSSTIPGFEQGSRVSWRIIAKDVRGLQSRTVLKSYDIFVQREPILFLENGLPFGAGTNKFFWMFGADEYPFDYWSNSVFGSEGVTSEFTDFYDVLMEFGGPFPFADMSDAVADWIAGGTSGSPRSYLLASQDYGCFISDCADITWKAGDFQFDYLGVKTLGPQDLTLTGGNAVWRLGPVKDDPISGPFYDYLATHDTLGLFYQPAFELTASFGNWVDGMVASDNGVAAFTDPSDDSYVLGVHTEGTGFKSVFLGFDPIGLDFQTLKDTSWVAWAIDYATFGTGTNYNAVDFTLDWFGAPSVSLADEISFPERYRLSQNFPNPFNPVTTLSFDLPMDNNVTLVIYNLLGQKVTTIVNDFRTAGSHRVAWNGLDHLGKDVSTGVYLYRIEAGDFSATKKMILLK